MKQTADYARLMDDEPEGPEPEDRPRYGPDAPRPQGLPGGTVMRELQYWVCVRYYLTQRGVPGYAVYELANPMDTLSGWKHWFRVTADTTPQAMLRVYKGIRKRLIEGKRPLALVPQNPELIKLHVYWVTHGTHMMARDADEIPTKAPGKPKWAPLPPRNTQKGKRPQ